MKRSAIDTSLERVTKIRSGEKCPIENIFKSGSSSTVPKCRTAVGYLYHHVHNQPIINKKLIIDLPEFLKPFGSKYIKNPKRLSETLKEFLKKHPEFVLECKRIFVEKPQNLNQHLAPDYNLTEHDLCSVCFKDTSSNALKDILCSNEAMKIQVHNHITYQISRGDSLVQVHNGLLNIVNSACRSFQKSNPCTSSNDVDTTLYDYKMLSEDLKIKVAKLEKSNAEILEKLKKNLTKYTNHLQNHAAYVQYFLNISQSELKVFDKMIFCQPREKETLEEILKRYPKVDRVSPANVHEGLFNEFLSFVECQGEEPNFANLGVKYDLSGKKGGNSKTCQSRFAQSICYNNLLHMKTVDPEKYKVVELIVVNSVQKRKNYEQFPIFESLSFPRLPSKALADKSITILLEQGKLLLGEQQSPESIKTYDYKTQKETVVYLHSRKNSLQSIREFILKDHIEKGFLRARKPEYYNKMSREAAIEILSRCGVYFDTNEVNTSVHSTGELRVLVQETETTRHYLNWYDNSTIGGISYILFNFQYLYSPAVYHSSDLSERDLQYVIEKPVCYFIGVSSSTTKREESYSKMRLDDIKLLAIPIVNDGIVFKDVYRFTTGDHPVRCVEAGNNKAGYWRIPGCNIKLDGSIIPFNEMVSSEHITIEKQREFVNRGGFFDDESNFGKSLQDAGDPRDMCKMRLGLSFKTKAEAEIVLKDELKGVRHQHLLLIHNPATPLVDLNLEQLEISPAEPLHDLKAIAKYILANIPGKLKASTSVMRIAKEVVSRQGDEKYLLKENHNGETIFKFIIQVTSHLEHRLFPEGLGLPCVNCGPLFFLNNQRKCEKCLIVGIYRSLCEIHVYGYQDFSKKTPCDILRFYNLVYILYKFILDFQYIYPDVPASEICSNIYFVDIIRYLPVMYELHNLLSLHAGRHESDFRVLKKVVANYSNMQHFSKSFLLHVLKKVEVKKYYTMNNSNSGRNFDKHKTSVVSKMITDFFNTSPKPEVGFHVSVFNNNDLRENLYSHLERISTFIVSNAKCDLTFMNYNQSSGYLQFPSFKSEVYPPFPIYNIFNCSIELILNTKHKCFQKIEQLCIQNRILNVGSFIKLVSGYDEIDTSCLQHIATPSTQCRPLFARESSYQTMLDKLNTVCDEPEGYGLLKYSVMTKCLAKIYGKVSPEILNLDKIIKLIELQQTKSSTAILKKSEVYHKKIHDYIVMIRSHIHGLNDLIEKVDTAIGTLSRKCDDSIIDSDSYQEDLLLNNEVYQLNVSRKKREAMEGIKSILEFESVSNLHIAEGL